MTSPEDCTIRRGRLRIVAVEVALIWIVFLLQAGWQVPEVNEPNYLAKAKHYWNPQWCQADVFLDTTDAHATFYWAFGWLTLLLPLNVVALLGRVISCGLMAWGWQRLSTALVPRRMMSVLSAGLFVTFNIRLHMAGEWVVGGVEGKCFSYALVFFALAAILRNRWNRGWILLGIASAFHVLVGGWATLAAMLSWCSLRRDTQRPRLATMVPALGLGLAVAMFGLIPVLGLARHQDPQIVDQAHRIQVYDRLPHHLNPIQFLFESSPPFVTYFGIRFLVLVVAWWALQRAAPSTPENRRLRGFVLGVMAITVTGCLVAAIVPIAPSLAAWLLRFYWFRMADSILPLAVALAIPQLIVALRPIAPHWARTWRIAAVALVVLHLGVTNVRRVMVDVPRADEVFCGSVAGVHDWHAMCDAVATSTPSDALFITPRHAHTFKWYTNRSEVATWKEMPQDAASIVGWWARLNQIHSDSEGRYPTLAMRSVSDLRALGAKFGAGYLVTESEPVLDLPKIYSNDSYAVYRLLEESSPSSSSGKAR